MHTILKNKIFLFAFMFIFVFLLIILVKFELMKKESERFNKIMRASFASDALEMVEGFNIKNDMVPLLYNHYMVNNKKGAAPIIKNKIRFYAHYCNILNSTDCQKILNFYGFLGLTKGNDSESYKLEIENTKTNKNTNDCKFILYDLEFNWDKEKKDRFLNNFDRCKIEYNDLFLMNDDKYDNQILNSIKAKE